MIGPMITAMTGSWRRMGRSGSMTTEFALVSVLMLTLVFGIFQAGMIYFANAGLKHGIGEAARSATLWPRRTDSQISAELLARSFGIDAANLSAPVITHGVAQGSEFTEISVSYSVPLTIPFLPVPVITLNETRRVYVP